MKAEDFRFDEVLGKAVKEAQKSLGHVNVLIAGRSGVGKSTLINSVFGDNLATTGQGRPITSDTRAYTKEGFPLTIFDTRGLEMEAYDQTREELQAFLRQRAASGESKEHIHIAWVCVSEDSRRVEDAESDLVTMLANHMPVIGVVTKARSDKGFRAEVQKLMPETSNIIRVRALEEELDDDHVLSQMGLDELVDATYQLIPEAHQRAFVAAQKASLRLKVKEARKVVAAASALAVAAGASPIPFSDAVILVPIQVGMLARISAIFGLDVTTNLLTTLVTSAAGTTAATFAGRAIVSNLIKLIPGAGSVVGGAISGSTAGAMTVALGHAYIAALKIVLEEFGDEPPSAERISEELMTQLKARATGSGDSI